MVSVLVPVYNCEPYIRECLDSIIYQDYMNLQVVVYNDGSTDGSLDILKEYAEKYDFIELYSDVNKGVATARNELLKHIKGEYFIFVDADDWIEPDMISFLLNSLKDNDADIAVCATYGDGKCDLKVENWDKDTLVREFLKHKRINGSLWNKLTKVSLLHNEQFRCGIFYGEDALFMWGILQRVNKITITNKPLYHYRPNPVSLSHQKWTPDRKGTGMIVWDGIAKDVESKYPEYKDIVYARAALEAMWALYFASISGYPYDEEIKKRQQFVRAHLHQIKQNMLDGYSRYVTARILSHWYGFGKFVNLMNTIKRNLSHRSY